ncbi:hemoglobin subunit alpha-like [Mobula birostris]|uniref:hemoglobin subunit alpha-like n=1 Tax=Mobula birostris TaxID=1983395 RepID=UPI003B2873ED
MVLSEGNKQIIRKLAKDIKDNAEALGADALARLFLLHPQTKTYFKKFTSFKANDASVKAHGCRVMDAVVGAAQHLDNLGEQLNFLAHKHGEELLVDPHNFHLFADCIAVTLAVHLPVFTPEVHCAVDKFLELLSHHLSSKYR